DDGIGDLPAEVERTLVYALVRTPDPVDGRRLDDAAATALADHLPADGLGDEEHAVDVDGRDAAPLVERVALERCEEGVEVRRLGGRVVVEDVDPAELRHDLIHHRGHGRRVRYVAGHPQALGAVRARQLCGGGPRLLLVQVDDGD